MILQTFFPKAKHPRWLKFQNLGMPQHKWIKLIRLKYKTLKNNMLKTETIESDKELINKIVNFNDSAALCQLTERHSGLIASTAAPYVKRFENSGQLFSDILENPHLIVLNTINKFDENRNTKFSTFLSTSVRWTCLNTVKANKNDLDNLYTFTDNETKDFTEKNAGYDTPNPDQIFFRKDDMEFVKKCAEEYSDPRIKVIIDNRYINTDRIVRYYDIGKQIGLTAWGTILLERKFFAYTKKKLKKDLRKVEI